jgi:hypothetical protein
MANALFNDKSKVIKCQWSVKTRIPTMSNLLVEAIFPQLLVLSPTARSEYFKLYV